MTEDGMRKRGFAPDLNVCATKLLVSEKLM
jgi:hypothetical protein